MDLQELKLKVYKVLLGRLTRRREYVFRFDYYGEGSRGNSIDDTNVVQYEFINQGTTIVNINGLLLQPCLESTPAGVPPMGAFRVPPSRLELPIRENEMDVSIYKYKFVGVPETHPDVTPYNSLLVISKVKADIATNKKG